MVIATDINKYNTKNLIYINILDFLEPGQVNDNF